MSGQISAEVKYEISKTGGQGHAAWAERARQYKGGPAGWLHTHSLRQEADLPPRGPAAGEAVAGQAGAVRGQGGGVCRETGLGSPPGEGYREGETGPGSVLEASEAFG